jgi:hypothetical protein
MPTSETASVSSLLGAAGPSLQAASIPANTKAARLWWSIKRMVILFSPFVVVTIKTASPASGICRGAGGRSSPHYF